MYRDADAVEECMNEISKQAHDDIERLADYIIDRVRELRPYSKANFGRKSAFELIGALMRVGLLPVPDIRNKNTAKRIRKKMRLGKL